MPLPFRRHFMRFRTILLIVCTCATIVARATHIIGGELFYDHLGGDDYQVTLVIYRDCGPGNTNGTGFDANAEIAVYSPAGLLQFSQFINLGLVSAVPVLLSNPCLTVPAGICVERAEYSDVMTLPSGTGGYLLAYQRCCRTPVTINLATPSTEGLTCMVQVPDAAVSGANSSPQFNAYPPIVWCANQAMVFDHSAVDPDGDLLTYQLCAPFNGGTTFNPLPSPPDPPPYTPVTYAPGYTFLDPMDATPPLAIDAGTGMLTATPTLSGSFVVGIMVKEFRAGVLLSEVRRDLRFDVVPCVVNVTSAIQQQQSLCTGTTLTFGNQSSGGSDWSWDFGDPLNSADSSGLFSPTWTYSDTGTFTVMLVVNPGWPCADTSYADYEVHWPIDPSFPPPPITCMDRQPVSVTATGNFDALANVVWDLGATGVTPSVNGNPGILAFTQPGTHSVTVTVDQFGCSDSHTDTVTIHPNPVAIFDGDTAGCTPLPAHFVDLSTAWTPLSWKWDFGDGGGSSAQHPAHTYGAAGAYDVRLEVMTTSGCVDTVAHFEPDFVQAWVQPVAGFFVTPPTVNVMEPTILVSDLSQGAVTWTYWLADTVFTDPSFLFDLPDAGEYTIVQVVSTSQFCGDTATASVIVRDHLFYAPNAFTPDGDGVNDVFLPSVIGAKEYSLTVFDRWGQAVFETSDKTQGWTGADFPNDTYVFFVRIGTYGTAKKEYTGHITLVR